MRTRPSLALAVAIAALAIALPRAHAGDSPLSGTWSGAVSVGGQDLAIDVTFTGGDTGTLDVPAQGAAGLALAKVAVEGAAVSFDVPVIGASFRGTLAGERLTGTMTQRGATLPFHLTRGKPRPTEVYTPPPPPPRPLRPHAGQALLGAWTGAVEVPTVGAVRIAARFEARGDLVVGAADDLAQCILDVPIDDLILTFDRVHFEVHRPGVAVSYFDGRLSGDTISGSFHQGGVAHPFTLTRGAPEAAADRPYTEQDVSIPSAPGVTLAGTLTLPAHAAAPAPVVVLVTGSGPQNRDECVLGIRPFRQLADHLARHGVATLRYDDRGTARSTGDFAAATAADFAADADAAVTWLAARTDVDVHHLGVLGHSEGGIIAPMVAVRDKAVAFIVLWAGPGLPLDQVIIQQVGDIERAEGKPAADVARDVALEKATFRALHRAKDAAGLRATLKRLVTSSLKPAELAKLGDLDTWLDQQVKQMWTPWFRWYLTYDPARTLAKVKVPVLALDGSLDKQVDGERNLAVIRKALARGHDRDVKIVLLPGLNHVFQRAKTGAVSEYTKLPPEMDASVLDVTTAWIRAHTGLDAPAPAPAP